MEGRVSVDKDTTMTWPVNEKDVWAPALVVDMCLGTERAKRVEIALPPWVGWCDGGEGAPPAEIRHRQYPVRSPVRYQCDTSAIPSAIPSAKPPFQSFIHGFACLI